MCSRNPQVLLRNSLGRSALTVVVDPYIAHAHVIDAAAVSTSPSPVADPPRTPNFPVRTLPSLCSRSALIYTSISERAVSQHPRTLHDANSFVQDHSHHTNFV